MEKYCEKIYKKLFTNEMCGCMMSSTSKNGHHKRRIYYEIRQKQFDREEST